MKILLTLLLLLINTVVFSQTYDVHKDDYVNDILDSRITKALKYDVDDYTAYNVYYEKMLIEVYHFYYIPYKQSENWVYYGTFKSGDHYVLNDELSNITYKRIKNICLKIK